MVDTSTDVTKISTSPILTQAQIITAILIGCVILTLVVLNIGFLIVYCKTIKSYKAEKSRNIASMFVNQVRSMIGSQEREMEDDLQKTTSTHDSNLTKPCSETESHSYKVSSDEESTLKSSPDANLHERRDKSVHVKKHVQIKSTKGRTESWSKKDHDTGKLNEKKGAFKQPGNFFKSVKKSNQDSSAFELSSDFTCVNMKNLRSVRSDSLTVNDIKTIKQFACSKGDREEKETKDMHMHRSVSESEGLGNMHAINIVEERQVNTVGKSYMSGPHLTPDHHRVMPFVICAGGSTSHLSSVTVTHGATVVQISDFGQTNLDDDNAETLSSAEEDTAPSANYLKAPVKELSFQQSHNRKCPSPRGINTNQKEEMKLKREDAKSCSPRGSIVHPKGHGHLIKEETLKNIIVPTNDGNKISSPRASFSHSHEPPALRADDNSHLPTKEDRRPMKDKHRTRKGSAVKFGGNEVKTSKKTKHTSKSFISQEKSSPALLKAEDKLPRHDVKDDQTLHRKSRDRTQTSSRGQDFPKGDKSMHTITPPAIKTQHPIHERTAQKDNSAGLLPGMCSVMCANHIASDVRDIPENIKHPCERNVSTDTINSQEVAILASQSDNYGAIEIVDHSSLTRLKRPRTQSHDIPVLEFQNLAFDSTENKNEDYIRDIEL